MKLIKLYEFDYYDYEKGEYQRYDLLKSLKENCETAGSLLVEVPESSFDFGDLLRIGGNIYRMTCASSKEGLATVEMITLNAYPEETEYTNEVTCPYCGRENESFELPDEDERYECLECGSIMSILREVTVTYSAEPVERNKIVNLEDTKND
ncbi:hypothetical protein [Lactococcus lactis]|uniref:hypothetical protein n=1 Tax=Lactococcus lactis TaxID=1358 RepID=UPI00071CF086|nr:hypothetical protein [Lactococcus lactis]